MPDLTNLGAFNLALCDNCGNTMEGSSYQCEFCGHISINKRTKNKRTKENGPYIINLEKDYPSTINAISIFEKEMDRAEYLGFEKIVIIHGYGSTGRGGNIKKAFRLHVVKSYRISSGYNILLGECLGKSTTHIGSIEQEQLNKIIKIIPPMFHLNEGVTILDAKKSNTPLPIMGNDDETVKPIGIIEQKLKDALSRNEGGISASTNEIQGRVLASEESKIADMRRLIQEPPEYTRSSSLPYATLAIIQKDYKFLEALIWGKFQLNIIASNGWAPIHAAILEKDATALLMLLRAGANPYLKTHAEWTFLIWLRSNQSSRFLTFLRAISEANL